MSDENKFELRMSFTEHLAELRTRLIRSAIFFVVAFGICYAFANQIFAIVAFPLSATGFTTHFTSAPPPEPAAPRNGEAAPAPAGPDPAATAPATTPPAVAPPAAETPGAKAPPPVQWTILNPLESILVQIKLAIYTALVISMPFIIYQACAFVFPGLHKTERAVVQLMILGCSTLAVVGVGVAYFGVFPLVLPYLLQWVPEGVIIQLRMNETISIIVMGLVGFAIAFQFPMAVLILVYMDLLTPKTLKEHRKIAIVGIAFASAILTPPDPFSMCIMMIPLVLLYEGSIWVSYFVVRRKKKTA